MPFGRRAPGVGVTALRGAPSSVLHRRLARGDAPAEALRRAFVDVGRADDELAPFRLGLMRVVGLGHEAPDARGVGAAPARADA